MNRLEQLSSTDPTGELFTVLASETRRRVVRHVDARPEPVSVETLASVVDDPAVELWHNHLPQLAVCGVIEWDREGPVYRGPNLNDAVRILIAAEKVSLD